MINPGDIYLVSQFEAAVREWYARNPDQREELQAAIQKKQAETGKTLAEAVDEVSNDEEVANDINKYAQKKALDLVFEILLSDIRHQA